MSPRDAALATRLSQACPGWSLRLSVDGYVLTPPDGDEALIGTHPALEDWLSHQERWAHESAHGQLPKPKGLGLAPQPDAQGADWTP